MDRTNFGKAGWIAAALCMVAGWIPAANAAQELTIDQQVQMVRSLSEAQRQATVAANVVLTETESTKFWPLYREYRAEAAKIGDRLLALIKQYSDNFESMTDAKAKTYATDYLSIEKQQVELKSKYLGKFDKVLPPVKTARILLIETKLDSMVGAGLAKTIPLVTAPVSTPPVP